MKSGTNNKSLKLIGATAVTLFSLVSVFAATIAWFAMNKDVGGNGMSITVQADDRAFTQLTIHRCDLSNSNNTTLTFNSTPAITVSNNGSISENEAVVMDNYSELNRTQPTLLLFTFADDTNETDISIEAISRNASYVGSISNQNVSNFPFSSVVNFKSAAYTTTFDFSIAVSSLTQSSSFVSFDQNDNFDYDSDIYLFSGSQNRVIKYVAVVMDYYEDALDYLFTNNVGYDSVAASNNNAIDFYCDWTLKI